MNLILNETNLFVAIDNRNRWFMIAVARLLHEKQINFNWIVYHHSGRIGLRERVPKPSNQTAL
jgi:hypothetical protein